MRAGVIFTQPERLQPAHSSTTSGMDRPNSGNSTCRPSWAICASFSSPGGTVTDRS